MPPVLDIAALRSFTSIADHGGFHRAADALGLSQSAVSQHVRRLEKLLGRPLVRREGRRMRFTPDGEALLAEARRILAAHDEALGRLGVADRETGSFVIGSTEHAADRILPAITRSVQESFPGYQVRFRLDRSSRLNEAIDQGTLDVAVFMGDPVEQQSASAGVLPLSWFSAPDWDLPSGSDPIRVVAIDSPCTIRRRAMGALAEHGLMATVVVEAAYLAGVVNAVRGGLGVALLADIGLPPEGLERRTDLPPVTPERLHLRSRAGAPRQLAVATLAAVRGLFDEH